MDYFRQRWKPLLFGFTVGLVVGWFQPEIVGKAVPDLSARVFLSLQMGAAFSVVALFGLNYLEVRRRAYAKILAKPEKQNSQRP